MLASTDAVLWTIASYAFVIFVLGFVLYALVRPFTHRDYEQGRWVHLP
jgi:hypothetical protein